MDVLSIAYPRKVTKESSIKAIIEDLGGEFDIDNDMSNPGSTIQAVALMKVVKGLRDRNF